MTTLYTLFKFLHIVGAIVWIGGVITAAIINALVARAEDRMVQLCSALQLDIVGMTMSLDGFVNDRDGNNSSL